MEDLFALHLNEACALVQRAGLTKARVRACCRMTVLPLQERFRLALIPENCNRKSAQSLYAVHDLIKVTIEVYKLRYTQLYLPYTSYDYTVTRRFRFNRVIVLQDKQQPDR